MGLLFESVFNDILVILLTIVVGIIIYVKRSFNYWEKRKVPYPEPVFPYGNLQSPFNQKLQFGFWLKEKYDELKALGHKHAGLYNFASPIYFVIDPEYVKNVMQKDFQNFVDRGVYYNEKDDPLSAHLFALGGEKWRNLRTKLTPTFTSGKMKMMFETLVACSHPMKKVMDEYAKNKTPVDIKEIVACFTTDIIGSCAFGLDCNSFKSPDAEFRKYGKRVLQFSPFEFFKLIIFMIKPEIGRALGSMITPKESSDFFLKVIKDTVKYRETNNFVRKDMLQLLIDMKNNKNPEDLDKHDGKALSIEEVASQAFVFFLAGFETSSTTLTFCLFELSTNQGIQEKLRKEIKEVLAKHDGKITYDALSDMKYMGQVIEETLRKYPPLTHLTRKCVKDYKVPNTEVTIEKGTMVFISPLGLQRDPEYFPDPEKFDPERFSEENKKSILPFTNIPFGEGPRLCIGLRFGMMQIKVALTVLLGNYKFSLNKQTEVPLKVDTVAIVYATKGIIWLDTEKIN